MLLAVDVGNSNTLVGVFDGDTLVHQWRISTRSRRTPDEVALTLQGLLALAGLSLADATGMVVASVVPAVTEVHRALGGRHVAFDPVIVEPGVRTGLPMRVDNPREIGADRIVNALAALELYGAPSIVVDFGTATSFDAVDRDGSFVGGAIAPGILISTEALAERAARLPRVEIVAPDRVIGRTTVSALQAGIVFGFAGQVDAVVAHMIDELGPGVTTVATGGLASTVLGTCTSLDHHDPWLTLEGLRIIWHRNPR